MRATFRTLIALLLIISSAWMMSAAHATPDRGAIVQSQVKLAKGGLLTLPLGQWKVVDHWTWPSPDGWKGNITIFVNQDPAAFVPIIVANAMDFRDRGNYFACDDPRTKGAKSVLLESFGTRASQLENRCVVIWGSGSLKDWAPWELRNKPNSYWSSVFSHMTDYYPTMAEAHVRAEISLKANNDFPLSLHLMVDTSKFMNSGDQMLVRPDEAESQGVIQGLKSWLDDLSEANLSSFYRQKYSVAPPLEARFKAVKGPWSKPVTMRSQGMALKIKDDDERRKYEMTRQSTNELTLEAFLDEYPASEGSADIRQRLEFFRIANGTATTPDSGDLAQDLAEQARRKRYEYAMSANTEAALNDFIAMDPDGHLADNVRQRLAFIQQVRGTSGGDPLAGSATNPAAPVVVANSGLSPSDDLISQVAALKAQVQALQSASTKVPVDPSAPTLATVLAPRKALVIGNDNYQSVSKLANAGGDAKAVANVLKSLGYKVWLHEDLSEKGFKQAVRDFKGNIDGGDEILFYFAGHGVQLGATNYLLPVDIKGDSEDQVRDDAVELQRVLDDLKSRSAKFTLAIVDACRDNPFKTAGRAIGGRGLAPTTAATGQMIMFSAGTGQQALDKLGEADREKNGLFTRVLLKEMIKPNVSVDRVLRSVRNEVVKLSRSVGKEQTPALYDQADGDFYFKVKNE